MVAVGGNGVVPGGEGEGTVLGHGGEIDFVEFFFWTGAGGRVVCEECVIVFESDSRDPMAVLPGEAVAFVGAVEANIDEDGGFSFVEGFAGIFEIGDAAAGSVSGGDWLPALEFEFSGVVSAEADEGIEAGDEVPRGGAGLIGAHEGGGAEITDEDDLALFRGEASEA